MKVTSIKKISKLEQYDISTPTANFYVNVGDTNCLIHNSPAIVFGRDENGDFILTDKSGFTAKGYDGKAKSAKELGQMLANRKAPMDKSRQQFIKNMMSIFDEFERAVPENFRGFLIGDLMYYTRPKLVNGKYVFQPNVVRYEVDAKSDLGKKIGQSKIGVVVHKYIGNQFNSTEEAIKHLNTGEVLVIPPVYVQKPAKLDTKAIDKLESFARAHANEIKELFNPENLKGIANIHQLMYKYINNKVDTGLEDLGKDFEQWLNTQKLTDRKRENILKYLKAHKKGVNALWTLIKGIMKVKDDLIRQFDAHPSAVQQYIGDQPGGEGYVVSHPKGPVKLVPRSTFTATNRALHR